MSNALTKDINRLYVQAVNDYELEIIDGRSVTVNSFANLAFIYWATAAEQFEFNIPNNIPDELSIIGGQRFNYILDIGLEKYPDSLELNFWKKYFPYRLYSADFSENDCKNLIQKFGDDDNLTPYFFLNLFDEKLYQSEVKQLLSICTELPTAKNNYLKSFIADA